MLCGKPLNNTLENQADKTYLCTKIDTTMKKLFLFLFVATLSLGLANCSQSAKSKQATDAESTENQFEGQTRDIDAVARANDQLRKMGVELDAEQQRQLEALAGKYDFNSATSQEQRRGMRQDLQKEIYSTVLTPEQQAIIDGLREQRGGGN
jgi:hypothetical protein